MLDIVLLIEWECWRKHIDSNVEINLRGNECELRPMYCIFGREDPLYLGHSWHIGVVGDPPKESFHFVRLVMELLWPQRESEGKRRKGLQFGSFWSLRICHIRVTWPTVLEDHPIAHVLSNKLMLLIQLFTHKNIILYQHNWIIFKNLILIYYQYKLILYYYLFIYYIIMSLKIIKIFLLLIKIYNYF